MGDTRKLQVVFLSYSASKWDALASVYDAARKDTDCDAQVVAMPHYNINRAAGYADLTYEADDYPPDVTITHYSAYKFEDRKPDIVFIHHPYDQHDINPTPPYFHTARIKEHAAVLVYVPYFSTEEHTKELEPFLTRQYGIMLSDVVCVGNAFVRECFIRDLKSMIKDLNADGGQMPESVLDQYLGDKIVVLGSPKNDQLWDRLRQPCALPEDWRPAFAKADGTQKKAVFYNLRYVGRREVGIGEITRQDFIKTMENAFALCKERKDFCLWIRPHPDTASFLNGEAQAPIRALIQDFVQAGYGIYDTTGDSTRPAVVCDGMYGASGSLSYFFSAQGKPVVYDHEHALGVLFDLIENAQTQRPTTPPQRQNAGAAIYAYCKRKAEALCSPR